MDNDYLSNFFQFSVVYKQYSNIVTRGIISPVEKMENLNQASD